MHYRYNDNSYNIEVIRKVSNKNTYLRVKDDLTLYITTNILMSDKKIEKLISDNKKSIDLMYEKQLVKNSNNEGFYYLGKKYDIVYTNSKDISFVNNKVFIGKCVDIDKWYKSKAKEIFKIHLDNCYNKFTMSIPYPGLKIRKMTTRWGVCNYQSKVITLNLELIKRDLSCLDYVIYHELSHLIYHDHSSNFWQLVEENCPSYKIIKRTMKNY